MHEPGFGNITTKEYYPQSPHGEQQMEWMDLQRSRSFPSHVVSFSHPIRDALQPPSTWKTISQKKREDSTPKYLILLSPTYSILLCNFITQTFMKRKSEMIKRQISTIKHQKVLPDLSVHTYILQIFYIKMNVISNKHCS